jgi:hypothetical protein
MFEFIFFLELDEYHSENDRFKFYTLKLHYRTLLHLNQIRGTSSGDGFSQSFVVRCVVNDELWSDEHYCSYSGQTISTMPTAIVKILLF